ncbi:MAG: hypothetical protein C0524_13080 [Rhodobacter sp.]|nr:hypothetical protein [Rhodobacter sp.]
MIARGWAAGRSVEVHEAAKAADVTTAVDGLHLTCADGSAAGPLDRVIPATGHDFPDADEATRSHFPSPWSGLIQAEVPAARVGIIGTSLSAIDAAMAGLASACRHAHSRRCDPCI